MIFEIKYDCIFFFKIWAEGFRGFSMLYLYTMKKTPKNPKQYICEKCTFISSNKKDYNKHLTTAKHINTTNTTLNTTKNTPQYICSCGKTYNYRASLYNHKKRCTYIDDMNNGMQDELQNNINEPTGDATTVLLLLKQIQILILM